jgi:hypothetical protein
MECAQTQTVRYLISVSCTPETRTGSRWISGDCTPKPPPPCGHGGCQGRRVIARWTRELCRGDTTAHTLLPSAYTVLCSFKSQLIGAPEFLWTKPGALGQLTQELLRVDFDLEWQARSDRLCPPVRELRETAGKDASTPLGRAHPCYASCLTSIAGAQPAELCVVDGGFSRVLLARARGFC